MKFNGIQLRILTRIVIEYDTNNNIVIALTKIYILNKINLKNIK